jgi:hypothetical protein
VARQSRYTAEYGFAERRDEFSEKYLAFLQSMDNLKIAIDAVLKAAKTKTKGHQVIWGLARLAFEDEFQAIILACANGYSFFAKQPLRALFEKVVTLLYLGANPKDVQLYLRFRYILQFRELKRLPHITRDAKVKRSIRRRYKYNKRKYPIPTRWHTKPITVMAKEVGIPESFIEIGYYDALQEAHPSLIAILYRYERKKDGSLWWKDDLPPVGDSERTLKMAHFFILRALEGIRDIFKIRTVDPILVQCKDDFLKAWNLPSSPETTS